MAHLDSIFEQGFFGSQRYLVNSQLFSKTQILPHNALYDKFLFWTSLQSNHGSYELIILLEKCGRLDLTVFHLMWVIGTYGNWKIKILGAVLELPAK